MRTVALRPLLPRAQVVAGSVFVLLLYVSLYFSTERWRVYSNDVLPRVALSEFLELHFWMLTAVWILPAFLYFQFVALLARRWRFAWCLLLAYLPGFFISYRIVIASRLRNSIVSCANHSGVWWRYHDYDSAIPLPDSLEFHDLLKAFWGDDLRLSGARCPGYRLSGTETGVIFVAGGLQLNSLRSERVLIGFCSSLSHPPPQDHQHCLTWEWAEVNGAFEGDVRRDCTDTADMIQRLEDALKRANSGQIPYSGQAQSVLRSELAIRKLWSRTSKQALENNRP